ncbi:MAG TPA: PIN domain-containing protein [Opitutaceae bacterium]|nr:PIN domain-containing protein [Opitutaceae bacterium]
MHHVFVDFENVQDIDLSGLGDDPVELTILLGQDQKPPPSRLLATLVERAGGVRLVKMRRAGRNALDMTLASQVGAAAARDPAGTFHIISEDTDYDPLIEHLQHIGIDAVRVTRSAPPPPLRAAEKPAGRPPRRPPEHPAVAADADRFAAVVQWLERNPKNRPTRHARLVRQINDQFGRRLRVGEAEAIAAALTERGLVAIDGQNRVTYPGFEGAG